MNRLFLSIRWKLVFTYLLLIILTLGLMLNFIITSIEKSQVEDHKNSLYTEANIISNQLIGEYENLTLKYTREYYAGVVSDFSEEISSRVIVLDAESHVLIDTFGEYIIEEPLTNHEIVEALKGSPSYGIYDFKSVGKVMYVAMPIDKQGEVAGVVLLASSLDEIYADISTLESQFLFLALICVAFTTMTSFIFVEILSSPIERLTESVNQVSFGGNNEAILLEGSDEIKVLSNSFQAMLVKLNQVDDQRKQLVADVSHELRTPLTSIKILSSALLSDETPDPLIYREFLTDIDMEIDRLNGIIDSLLYLFDLEKDETDIDISQSNLNSLVVKVIGLLQPIAGQKNVHVNFKSEKEILCMFDREKMHQCLSNLISNAIKYNRPDGEINVELLELEDVIRINVIDNGYGIEPEEVPYIFERFYRADKARNRETGGTGLGLSIVQQIITLHGGQVRVKSTLDVGSTFTIEIPKVNE